MKELSIKEKAKRYDEAIEKAKKELQACGSQDCDAARQIFRFFPELKESDDEEIRKAIIKHFENLRTGENLEKFYGVDIDAILTWLEKQGKQKPADKVEPKFKEGEWVVYENRVGLIIRMLKEHYIISFDGVEEQVSFTFNDKITKKIEQKPAWSKEDENGLSGALWAIKQARTIAKDENDMGNLWYAERWLKSLRPQNTWKPSKEQMDVLLSEVNAWTKGCHKQIVLESLYNDLQKLKS